MADEEERKDDTSTEPSADAPTPDGGGREAEQPADDSREAEEAAADSGEAEQPSVDSAEPDAIAEAPQKGPPAKKPGEKKADEPPPGADLEPIQLEEAADLDAEQRARLEAEAEERARREREATAEVEEAPAPRRELADLARDARYSATGKRKSSVARVLVKPGSGTVTINGRTIEEFFPRLTLQVTAKQPLVATGYDSSVDVRVRVHGGGVSSQAGAVRHGIARALTEIDPQLRGELKRRGFLTRDARVKERRKAGLKKARKRPQFSKR
jgi:small subunit ribosomal protein S9